MVAAFLLVFLGIGSYRDQVAGGAEIERKIAEGQRFAQLYRNPLFNAAVSCLEPLPVGLLLALGSAAVLRKPSGTAG